MIVMQSILLVLYKLVNQLHAAMHDHGWRKEMG